VENFLIAAAAVVIAFLAGYRFRAVSFQRRRRKQNGFY
jgi:hypothetical protein